MSQKEIKETPQEQLVEQTLKEPVFKRQLWKLIKGKYLITFQLCYECQDNLFNSQDKFVENSDGVTVKLNLCNKCIKTNCFATDILTTFKKSGTKRKAE